MIYDVMGYKEVKESPSGMKGQISWQRLSNVLRDSGEIAANECITHFETKDHFLIYTVGDRK